MELSPGYHIRNFLTLIDFVEATYGDLLDEEESDFVNQFRALSESAQSLYVRMVTRKGPVFRSDKLKYADILDVDAVASELKIAGFADTTAENDEIIALLLKHELRECLNDDDHTRYMAKVDLLEAVRTTVVLDRTALPFTLLRPLRVECLLRYRLLFFGNTNQDLTEFVLTDMGLLTYEDYTIPTDARLFGTREMIDKVWQLILIRDQLQELIEIDDAQGIIALAGSCPDSGGDPLLSRRRDRIRNSAARQLERYGLLDEALAVYENNRIPPARERQTRILYKLGRHDQVLRLCRDMIESPIDETEKEFARRFGQQVAAKMGRSWSQLAIAPEFETINLRLCRPADDAIKVEEITRRWFAAKSGTCFYVENALMPGLFGLLFWDIIFHPVRGAFVNPYQRGPLDLFTPDFREQRETLLQNRLEECAQPAPYCDQIRAVYHSRHGIANNFVSWSVLTEELLEIALDRIPVEQMIQVFRRLLGDLANNRSGFPDLVCFPDAGGYELIEVKGPGDQLQLNQKRWIKAFSDYQIPFRLARVEWRHDD